MEERRGKLMPGWLQIAVGMPIRGQEPVEGAAARLAEARKALAAALKALDEAVGK